MNPELDQLKEEKERRMDHVIAAQKEQGGDPRAQFWIEAEHALDRAIEIAEGTQQAFNLMMDERVNVSTGELEQARADVLKLRDELGEVFTRLSEKFGHVTTSALVETEHYEQHR